MWGGGGGYARAGGVVLPPGRAAPAQGNARRAPKVSVKPFQRLAESRDRVSGRSRRSERFQGDYKNSRACAEGYEAYRLLIRCTAFIRCTTEEQGNGLCGGRPLRRLRATPPLSGEARPKSRLRRLAVGAAGAALWGNDLRLGL